MTWVYDAHDRATRPDLVPVFEPPQLPDNGEERDSDLASPSPPP